MSEFSCLKLFQTFWSDCCWKIVVLNSGHLPSDKLTGNLELLQSKCCSFNISPALLNRKKCHVLQSIGERNSCPYRKDYLKESDSNFARHEYPSLIIGQRSASPARNQ